MQLIDILPQILLVLTFWAFLITVVKIYTISLDYIINLVLRACPARLDTDDESGQIIRRAKVDGGTQSNGQTTTPTDKDICRESKSVQ